MKTEFYPQHIQLKMGIEPLRNKEHQKAASNTPARVMYIKNLYLQFSSVTQLCLTLGNPMNHTTPGLPVHHQLQSSLRLMSIESVMPSSHLILCHPLLLLPPIPHSIKAFSSEPTLRMRWSKYWSFSFSIIPSKEIPGLISFRIDWLALPAVYCIGIFLSGLLHSV